MPGDSTALQSEPVALPIAPGQIIAERYLVGEVLGGGGMGVVCAGTHVLLGTPVAIKLIHSDLKDDAEAVQRFVNEARATAGLKGEHIARVFDAGQLESGEPYLVMEQLEGLSLDQYLQGRGALPVSEVVGIVLQVCEGMAEAHAAALVHRDLKPANLFLARRPDGKFSVKIIDFGIAKQRVRADTPALTNPGKSLGSPWYMSPEQMLTPASVDERADVWSIGVLLFELLTARLPFEGESVPQVCATVLTASPPRPSDLRGDLTPELDAIVLRCLEKEPPRRFQSVGDLAQALRPFASVAFDGAASFEPALSSEPDPAVEARRLPTYDSLTPVHSSRDVATRRRSEQRAIPLALTFVAFCSLLFGGYLQYRDPTLVRRALSATRITLPWDPALASTPSGTPLQPSYEPPVLLETLHGAHALPEPQRQTPDAEAYRAPARERPRARSDGEPTEPTPQGTKRLAEERYGL